MLTAKIIVLGAKGVGKTTLITRLVSSDSDAEFAAKATHITPTTAATASAISPAEKVLSDLTDSRTTVAGNAMRLELHDTVVVAAGAGALDLSPATTGTDVRGVVFVYDVTSSDSFETVAASLHRYFEGVSSAPTAAADVVFIIGTKLDLVEKGTHDRAVEEAEAEELADSISFAAIPVVNFELSCGQIVYDAEMTRR